MHPRLKPGHSEDKSRCFLPDMLAIARIRAFPVKSLDPHGRVNLKRRIRFLVSPKVGFAMIDSIFTFFRLFFRTLRGSESPKQLAWGVALGMGIGLIPNDSLFVAILAVLTLATKTNLFVASLAAILFSWAGFLGDDALHRLGARILTVPGWQAYFAWASQAPILPWTRFNNTVVMGSTALSIVICYPVYYLSHAFFENVSPRIHQKLTPFRIYRFLTGTPVPTTSPGDSI